MAYLGKYIRQILSRKEAVVLPGFGSLLLEQGKGIQREDGKIDPPGAVIRFDATHPNDDGKLAGEYAEGEDLDQEEARQQVLELVDAIKFKLDKGETYQLETVGEFSRDDDNRIHFAKDPNWVIDPELFGLSSLDLIELEEEQDKDATDSQEAPAWETRERTSSEAGSGADDSASEALQKEASEEKQEQKSAVDAPSAPSDKTSPFNQQEPIRSGQDKKKKRKLFSKWRIIWIVAGALIIVLALILLLPSGNGLEVGKDGIIIRNTQIGTGDNDAQEAGSDQQSVGEEETDNMEAAAKESLREEEEIEEGPVQPPVQGNKYFIIAGSFQNLVNATEMVDDLKAAGYPAEIILTENRLYRVSIQSYATKQEALDALPNVKSGEGMSNAWLLTR